MALLQMTLIAVHINRIRSLIDPLAAELRLRVIETEIHLTPAEPNNPHLLQTRF